jgi:hypothetical protein
VTSADFNQDGKPDLAVANYDDYDFAVGVLLWRGDGTFGDAVALVSENNQNAVIAGDFDGDGTLDLAVASDDPSNALYVLLGKGCSP